MSCLASEVWLESQHDRFIEDYGDLISAVEEWDRLSKDILDDKTRTESAQASIHVVEVYKRTDLYQWYKDHSTSSNSKRSTPWGSELFVDALRFYDAYMNYSILDKKKYLMLTHRQTTPDHILKVLESYFEPEE